MRRTLLVLVLGALLSAAAAPAASSESAGAFVTRILREEIHGQWALQWSQLHPGHQRLITKAQYVHCSRALTPGSATGQEIFRVLDVRDEKIVVKGVPQRTSKRVTIKLGQPGKTGVTYHAHAVNVGGRWAWILGEPFLSALARGQCLDGSRLLKAP